MASVVDRRPWSNLLQLISGCVCAAIGAIVAYPLPPNTNWLAAIIGAVLGFIAAVFITGAFLAFMPAAKTHRFVDRATYLRLVRRSALTIKLYLLAIGMCAVLYVLLSNWIRQQDAVFYVIIVHTIPYLLAQFMRLRVLDIGCPSCSEAFGLHNPFKPDEHVCANCQQPFLDPAS